MEFSAIWIHKVPHIMQEFVEFALMLKKKKKKSWGGVINLWKVPNQMDIKNR